MKFKKYYLVCTLAIACLYQTQAQTPYSQQMTRTVMNLWKDSLPTGNRWTYD